MTKEKKTEESNEKHVSSNKEKLNKLEESAENVSSNDVLSEQAHPLTSSKPGRDNDSNELKSVSKQNEDKVKLDREDNDSKLAEENSKQETEDNSREKNSDSLESETLDEATIQSESENESLGDSNEDEINFSKLNSQDDGAIIELDKIMKENDELIEKDSLNEHELSKQKDSNERQKGFNEDEIDFSKLNSLTDDEAIIELDKIMKQNDELIEKDYLGALLKQDENLVYYEVENIYHNEKKRAYKNRLRLRRDPPVLTIRDEEGNEAKFQLTENLTDELSETLKEVKRAYYGFSGPRDINKPEKFLDRMKYYAKENAFKILATIFIVLFIVSLNL